MLQKCRPFQDGDSRSCRLSVASNAGNITASNAAILDRPALACAEFERVLVMVTFRFCSAVQPIPVSEGARFSKPRATPSLYYTC